MLAFRQSMVARLFPPSQVRHHRSTSSSYLAEVVVWGSWRSVPHRGRLMGPACATDSATQILLGLAHPQTSATPLRRFFASH